MEEILSSIKRIIAEEGDGVPATRSRRPSPPPRPAVTPRPDVDEVLELSEPVADELPEPRVEPVVAAPLVEQPVAEAAPLPQTDAPAAREPILSERAVEATRAPLEALSRMVVKPEVPGSDTLEGLVTEMLKPMLREWLDANLPQIVERMVAREISRITDRGA